MAANLDFLATSVESFQQLTKKPEGFLEKSDILCKEIQSKLKEIYDFTKIEEIKTVKSSALPELIVKNFDLEQIWQELELQNESLLTRSITNVSKLIVGKSNLVFNNLEAKINAAPQNETEEEMQVDEAREENSDNASETSEKLSESEEEIDENDVSGEDTAAPPPLKKSSEIDDEFFNLNEMEKFCNAEERKLNDPDSGNDTENSDSESEESINLFEGESDDEEEAVKTAKYKDFFVANETAKKEKRNKFLEEMDSEVDEKEDGPKSSFEMRQERLGQKIEELEEDAVAEKPWQLKGEVAAASRPQNSLLQEVVEFDMTTRPAPVITEQTSMQLEDIIRQRIKDKVFDSVERKAKPVETPLEYKKKLVLDQEKNKESLAQIYEKDFLNQKASLDPENAEKEPEEPQLHKEITTMMNGLFTKLDALSNFHFTPKPAIPELKIISNLPAINMEEVAPVATSGATLLAPEEVKNKTKGEIMGEKERTATDKNRERRKKKIKQKIHVKEKQKKESLLSKLKPGLGNKYSKEKTKKMLESVTKDRNVDKMDETSGSKSVKSSTAFFTQLQEEVQSQIKSKVKRQKKVKGSLDAKRMKL